MSDMDRRQAIKYARSLVNRILRSKDWTISFTSSGSQARRHRNSNKYITGKIMSVTLKRVN